MKFSTIKVAFLALASLVVGAEGQKGKGKGKCNCIKNCIDNTEAITDAREVFYGECLPECDEDCENANNPKRCERKEKRCTKKCAAKKAKVDEAFQALLVIAKEVCEAGDCEIDPVCDVTACTCDCEDAEDKKACKRACMKCKDPLMKKCHDTCVYDDTGCVPECTSCLDLCASCKTNEPPANCKEDCKACHTDNKECLEDVFENPADGDDKKECFGKCACDYPFKKRKGGKGGGGKGKPGGGKPGKFL